MTPCEEKGYKVGDEFVVVGDDSHNFDVGGLISLIKDDGSDRPGFRDPEGLEQWVYLTCVRPAGIQVITRTNGQPFATEASARQQLTAKGLQDTHEVVPHEGGYALAPIQRVGDPITLQPGDYVSTEGMTEEQYHAVARAFENAGCPRFCPNDGKGRGEILEWYDGALFSCFEPEDGGRHLTIEQVLGATNAGNAAPKPEETTMTTDPITTLKQARQARDEAEQAYQEALGEAREFIGDGFELTEVDTDGPLVDGKDMTDPANWQPGDIFTVLDGKNCDAEFENGQMVRLCGGNRFEHMDGHDYWHVSPEAVRFHHRPA